MGIFCQKKLWVKVWTLSRNDAEKIENILAGEIIDAAIEVHRILGGPGLLESQYEEALCQELRLRDISVQAQVLTYLRLIRLKLGLLLNFGQKLLRDGIERVVNDL